MTTNFPGGLDDFVNPAGTSLLTNPDHAGQHTDLNDAVEALEAKVGVNGSLVTSSIDYKLANDVVLKSVVDAKGDLIAGTASDAVGRVPVGADDTVLMARGSESTGLAWGAPRLAGGGARPLLTGGARLSGSGLVLNGLASNFASSPDSAALSITGDIDIKVKVALTDWTPSSAQMLVNKATGTGNQRSYWLTVLTTGVLRFSSSTDGTSGTQTNTDSTVATGITDGATKWVRVTRDVNDGAGNRVTKFYTSDDGTSWTQLGTTVTTVGTISQFDSTAVLETGMQDSAGSPAIGTFYRTIIQSAFDTADNTTSLVYDANFETATADALAFTESSSNAATVTINTTRYTVGLPGHGYTGSVSTLSIAANNDHYLGFNVVAPISVDMLRFEITTGPATSATLQAAIYAADNDFSPIGSPIINFGPITLAATGATATLYAAQVAAFTLQPGAYIIGVNPSQNISFRTYRAVGSTGYLVHTLGATAGIRFIQGLGRTSATFPSNPSKPNAIGTQAVPWDDLVFLRYKAV